MANSTVNERIMNLVQVLSKGNKSAFSKAAGISNQSLAEILGKRQSAPSFSALQKIHMEWLIMGKGEMLKTTEVESEVSAQELEEAIQHIWTNQFIIRNEIGTELQTPSRILEMEEAIKWSIRTINRYEAETESLVKSGASEADIIKHKSLRADFEAILSQSQESLAIERKAVLLANQEVSSRAYRINGQPDITRPYGGLLTYRLGISAQLARQLVSTGRIEIAPVPDEEYCITEDAVRTFMSHVAATYEKVLYKQTLS
jgi:hypothetical protein